MAATVYRDWHQGELDRQLNLRARWPEHGEFFARWARDSEAVRARLGGHFDLAYGASEGETLDLFPAARQGPAAPLLAFLHGGYWQGLDKGDFSYLAPAFLASGVAFASLNYDLAPKVSIADIVGQIRNALSWLARNAGAYGLDAHRIFVAGHSAGGHLAVMALVTDWSAQAGARGDLPADLVKGACSVSGIYELEPLRLSYHQPVLKLDPETVRVLSPIRCSPARAGPVICAVGSAETEEFLRQQDEFVATWRARDLAVRVVELPGLHHFSAIEALGDPRQPLFVALRELILGGG
ncbi:MAG: alpha/beta hydrolase [Kiloniellaceae bacterium]